MTERAAADRVHAALKASHTALFGRIEGARLEQRKGYLLLVCPPLPIAALNGVWADDPGDEQSAVNQLGEAIAEVEALGLPCSVQMRAGLTPALEAGGETARFRLRRVGARDGRDGRRPAEPRPYGATNRTDR